MIHIDINIVRELKALALRNKIPDTPEQRSAKALAAKVIGLVEDGRTMANNWGFYLFSSELAGEPQLRDKISVVMISGLLDTVEAKNRVIEAYRRDAKTKGFENIVAWCDRAKEWCTAAENVLSLFSKEEQLFIQDTRNRLVHGWLNNTHRERIRVKYFNGATIVSTEVVREEYFDLLKVPMFGVRDGNIIYQKSIDEVLGEFTKRFINPEMDFWRIVNGLNRKGMIESVYQQIYSDIGISWEPGLNLIPDDL